MSELDGGGGGAGAGGGDVAAGTGCVLLAPVLLVAVELFVFAAARRLSVAFRSLAAASSSDCSPEASSGFSVSEKLKAFGSPSCSRDRPLPPQVVLGRVAPRFHFLIRPQSKASFEARS